MFWLVTCLCHWILCVKCYFGNSFESPKPKVQVGSSRWWRSLGWIPTRGDLSTFHVPRSPHASFLWCSSEVRGERGGSVSRAVHVWNLCSFPCSAAAASRSGTPWLSVLGSCVCLPCPVPPQEQPPCIRQGTGLLCAWSSSARSPLVPLKTLVASLFLKATY